METLPVEMVLKISRTFTPEDLSHCCGVSRRWREIFSQDWLWQPHCDPKLEEHLRTTPPVVEPPFVTPGGEDSTLAPIGPWRLAFLMEKHLMSNWKHNYHKTETLNTLSGEVHHEFLSNTHIVRCWETHLELWDVRAIPSVSVAKTDPSVVDITNWVGCRVADGNLFVVEQTSCIKVLCVDEINKQIQLKHDIVLNDVIGEEANSEYMIQLRSHSRWFGKNDLNCVKKNVFIHVNTERSNLDIYSLETGEKVKEQLCPETSGEQRPKIYGISTTPTTDYIVVLLNVQHSHNYLVYIYNPEKFCFLLGPIVDESWGRWGNISPNYGKIHSHYFSIKQQQNLMKIYDCHSREVLGQSEDDQIRHRFGGFYCYGLNQYFILKVCSELTVFLSPYAFKVFSLTDKTWKTINTPRAGGSILGFKVLNDKLLVAETPEFGWYLLSGENWVMCDVSFNHSKVNEALTKVVSQDSSPEMHVMSSRQIGQEVRREPVYIHHYW